MAADGDIVLGRRAPLPWCHGKFSVGGLDAQHRLRRVAVELGVQPADEVARRRLGQPVICGQTIDLLLDTDMGGRFDLEVASPFVLIEVADQRARDIRGPRVVALDEVAVVGVHQAYEIGEVRGCRGMQPGAQGGACRTERCDRIGDRFRRLLQPGRLDPRRCFNDVIGRCHEKSSSCFLAGRDRAIENSADLPADPGALLRSLQWPIFGRTKISEKQYVDRYSSVYRPISWPILSASPSAARSTVRRIPALLHSRQQPSA